MAIYSILERNHSLNSPVTEYQSHDTIKWEVATDSSEHYNWFAREAQLRSTRGTRAALGAHAPGSVQPWACTFLGACSPWRMRSPGSVRPWVPTRTWTCATLCACCYAHVALVMRAPVPVVLGLRAHSPYACGRATWSLVRATLSTILGAFVSLSV